MKNIMIGLLALSSISAFAENNTGCTFAYPFKSDPLPKTQKILASLGYTKLVGQGEKAQLLINYRKAEEDGIQIPGILRPSKTRFKVITEASIYFNETTNNSLFILERARSTGWVNTEAAWSDYFSIKNRAIGRLDEKLTKAITRDVPACD